MSARWSMSMAAVLFALAYGQAPLFYSNQNQYLLHGFAAAGDGFLADDWLAQTADPTPVYSGFVALIVRIAHPWMFHVCHAILLAVYAASLVGIFRSLFQSSPGEATPVGWLAFLTLLAIIHAAASRWFSFRLMGQDYPWYLQAGLAGQYVLGAMFQPSVFGVLLLTAIALFLHGRFVLAGLAIAICATVHSTYVLPGAMITAGFLTSLLVERRVRDALVLGGVTLAGTLPIVIFVAMRFEPTSADSFAAGQDILVNVRIPHHCRVDLWLDPVAGMQIVWIVVGLILTWRTRLFPVIAVPLFLATILTILQVATGSRTLALLFPWRVSAILVPLATAIVLARLVARLRLGNSAVWWGVLVVLASLGVVISLGRLAFRTNDDELPLYEFVRTNAAKGDLYLIPTKIPDLVASTRGSFSSDFKPLAEKKTDARIIPLDLQRFRLMTGTPIYVDFKSIPYKDVDVIEWRRRMDVVKELYDSLDRDETVARLKTLSITHVVVPVNRTVTSMRLERVHEDHAYQVFRVR